jgi:hypothetical protein
MTEKTDTMLVQQLRELRALREDISLLRADLRAVEVKVDGLSVLMAAIAGQTAGREGHR